MIDKERIHEVIDLLPSCNSLSYLLDQLRIKLIYDDYMIRDGYSYMGNIVIKKSLDNESRKFVICHEIGHVLLHSNMSLLSFSKQDTIMENEANYFSCLLLHKLGYSDFIPNEMNVLNSSTYPQ